MTQRILVGMHRFLRDVFDFFRFWPYALESVDSQASKLNVNNDSAQAHAAPGDQLLRERLAELHVLANQSSDAEATLLAFHKESPRSQRIVTRLAQFYLDEEKPVEAEKLIRESKTRGVTSPELQNLLVQATSAN